MQTVLVHDPLFEMQGCELLEFPESQGSSLMRFSVTPVPQLCKSLWGTSTSMKNRWKVGGGMLSSLGHAAEASAIRN